ncbi:MFS transporter [bacterium]|nr:MFS transporter [bacterium]MBU1636959.1 MFS transporter [bacterium]MBU1920532.1 MFS transporter [bacterium]
MNVSTTTDTAVPRKRSPFKRSFWVANTMEIFERLAWYGFFAVSTLYITGSRSEGALGFSSEERGILQAIVPFILYMLPVVFGALADRFGYKKTFIIAYSVMVPAYYLLGQFTTFGTFFMAFLFVAVGAAIFKPVVVGTVARTTDETNSSMGFGIFYMMVNVGGFIGPVVAGFVRVRYGWDFVFIASAFWIACNFIWLLLFYKEPTTESSSTEKRTLGQVFGGIVEVLGNGRFFLMVFAIFMLIAVSGQLVSWNAMLVISIIWLLFNILIDKVLKKAKNLESKPWFLKPMKLGNWKFALYLLILSGFWTSFNQIFLTMPEYIRDYVETKDMVHTARNWFGENFARELAAVNEDLLAEEIGIYVVAKSNTVDERLEAVKNGSWTLAADTIATNDPAWTRNGGKQSNIDWELKSFRRHLFDFKVRLSEEAIKQDLESLPLTPAGMSNSENSGYMSDKLKTKMNSATLTPEQKEIVYAGLMLPSEADVKALSHHWAENYRQVNPEYIINVDAGAIVVFQVLVSWAIGFFPPLSVMVVGIIVSSIGIGMSAWLFTGWLIVLAITIFAFGEMIASPKSQEYVGRIAPQQKVAMYMGFYFWTVALGNIFGGRLSGELYGSLARDAGRPDLMWIIFGVLGLLTAVLLIVYDKVVIGKGGKME